MTGTGSVPNFGDSPTQTNSILTTLTNQMTEALFKVQTTVLTTKNSTAPIGIKLDGSNYALWSHVVEMYISSKDKTGIHQRRLSTTAAGRLIFLKMVHR
jgi:hypothetical protein